jgi:hypothetical protein
MPDILRSLGLDVYALTDADTDEAHTFTTYSGYWLALVEHVEQEFGVFPYPELLVDLERRGLSNLASKQATCNEQQLRSLLLNAWSSELAMYDVELDNPRLWLSNQWAQVKAYYASTRMAGAWLLARDGTTPENHAGLLRAVSTQVTAQRLYPSPWSLCCTRRYPTAEYTGFSRAPEWVSPLTAVADRHDRTGMMLRTTRERDIERLVELLKKKRHLGRAPNGESARQDKRLVATTVFDFASRMRHRSNYGDPAMFYVGTLTADRAREYAAAIRTFTGATMFLFEALVSQKSKAVVADAAVHFTSRDRSQLADQVIVPRLKVLGLI